jgi:hypothetical protein
LIEIPLAEFAIVMQGALMMSRFVRRVFLGVLLTACGCGGPYKEPTIDNFDGRLVHKEEPVSFPEGEEVRLQLAFHKNGERFGVPIKPDGSFDIGWMPIGSYSATLERRGGELDGARSAPARRHEIKGGFTVVEGQTEYEIELGDDYKP